MSRNGVRVCAFDTLWSRGHPPLFAAHWTPPFGGHTREVDVRHTSVLPRARSGGVALRAQSPVSPFCPRAYPCHRVPSQRFSRTQRFCRGGGAVACTTRGTSEGGTLQWTCTGPYGGPGGRGGVLRARHPCTLALSATQARATHERSCETRCRVHVPSVGVPGQTLPRGVRCAPAVCED